MAQTVKLKRTSVADKVPTTSDIEVAELAFNTNDKALFIRGDSNAIVTLHDENTLKIDHSNNRVGILKSAPLDPLHVTGVIRTQMDGNNAKYIRLFGGNSGNFLDSYGNTLYIRPAGNTALATQLDTAGNLLVAARIGIGTTAPGVNLDIESSTNNAQLELTATDGTDQSFGIFGATGNNSNGAGLYIQDKTASGSPIRLKIDTSGNVGIGTSSPSQALHVVGNGLYTGGLTVGDSSADTFITRGHTHLATSGNNVGIGTTSPDFKLDVTGASGAYSAGDNIIGVFQSATDHQTALKIKNLNSNATASAPRAALDLDTADHEAGSGARLRAQFVLRSNASSGVGGDTSITVPKDLRFFVNNKGTLNDSSGEQASSSTVAGTEALRITDQGNVGIGTTTPTVPLEVFSSGTTQAKFMRDLTTDVGLTIGADNAGAVLGTVGVHHFQFYANGGKRLNVSGTGAITFNNAYTFPTSDGSANQVLQTDGSGNLTFASVSGGSGTITGVSNMADNRVITADGSTTINAEANLTFDGTNLELPDNKAIRLGTGNDLRLLHDGSSSIIDNANGHLDIKNSANDADIRFYCDDGSGGLTQYFRLDGSLADGTNTYTRFPDGGNIALGASNDLRLYHDGSNSYINNFTGNLEIRNDADDGDINFRSDNGSGGLTTYFAIDGGDVVNRFYKDAYFTDGVQAKFGSSSDLRIKHDGTNGTIDNYTGDLLFRNNADDKDIVLQSDNGSGGLTDYIRLDGSAGHTKFSANTMHTDSVNAIFGTGSDLLIFHDGSNSFVHHNGTGALKLKEGSADAIVIDGGVTTINHSGSARLNTTSTGIDVTGEVKGDSLDIDGNADISGNLVLGGNLTVSGTSTTLNTATLDVEDKNITLNKGSGDTSASANGAGITIQDAVNSSTDATILWDATNDEFDFSHPIKTSNIGVTNIVTNKVVKFNGSVLDDSNITDTGSLITLGSNSTVSGTMTAAGPNTSPQIIVENTSAAGSHGAKIRFKPSSARDLGPYIMSTQRGSESDDGDIQIGDEDGTIATFNFGRMGVGTISPAALFNAYSTSTIGWSNLANAHILTGTTTAGIGIDSNEIASKGDHLYFGTIDAKDIVFRTNGANARMTILSGGQTAINAGSARTTGGTAQLTIAGSSSLINMGPSNTDNMYIRRMGAGLLQMQTYNSGNTGHIELEPYGGKVGIGTHGVAPAALLHVKNYVTGGTAAATVASGTNAGIYLEDDSTPSANYFVSKVHNTGNGEAIGGIKFAVSPDSVNYNWAGIKALISTSAKAGTLAFYTSASNTSADGSTERMRIDQNGNVGIGINDPGQKLDVGGIIRSYSTNPQVRIHTSSGTGTGYLVFGDSADDDVGQVYYSHSSNVMGFVVGGGSADVTIDSGGAVTAGGTVNAGGNIESTGASLIANSSELVQRRVGGWTVPLQTVIGSFYGSNLGDYAYLKAPGNSTAAHGMLIVGDNSLYYGRTSIETGNVANDAEAPLDESVAFKIDQGGDARFKTRIGIGVFPATNNNSNNNDTTEGNRTAPLHIRTTAGGGSGTQVAQVIENYANDYAATPLKLAIDFKGVDSNNSSNFARLAQVSVNDTDYGDNNEATSHFIMGMTQNGTYTERFMFNATGHLGIGSSTAFHPTNQVNTGSYFKPDTAGKFLNIAGGSGGAFINLQSGTTTDSDQVGGIYWTRTAGQGDAHKQVAGIDVTAQAYVANDLLEGGNMRFFTKPSGAGVNVPRMEINSNGQVSFMDSSGNADMRWNQTDLILNDSNKLKLGTSGDLEIYHNGTDSWIHDNGTGNLNLKSNGTFINFLDNSNNLMAYMIPGGAVALYHNTSKKLETTSTGVTVTGLLSATTKSFDIEHPSKEGMRLKHGVVEGPEHSVYVRGRSKEKVILLPDYWPDLIHEDTITVQLTAIGGKQEIFVEDIKDNKVYVNCAKQLSDVQFFYYIQAERKDVDRFEVEYEG